MTDPGVDGLALLERQLERREPPSALDAEQIRARRLALQTALQDRVDLVLRARSASAPNCSRRASRRRSTRQRSSGIHTDSSSPDHNSLAKVRASSRSVFARACVIPVSSGLTTTTRSTCGSRIRATSQQLPVTSNATRSDDTRLCASNVKPSGVLGTRPAGAHLAVLADRDHAEVTVNVQSDRSTDPPRQRHPHLHQLVDVQRENQRDNDTDRYVLAAQSRQVAGAAERKARARSPSRKPAYPPAFSQQSPCPGSPDATAGPGQSLQRAFSCRERR